MIRQFQVSTRRSGRRRTVQVKVYDDLAKLRCDADRYSSSQGRFDQAVGVAHTWNSMRVGSDGKEEFGPAAGMVRLSSKHLGTSVIVHEMTHVACGIYRQDWQPEHGPTADDMDHEEVLCHLVGDLTRRVVDKLYELGCYAAQA